MTLLSIPKLALIGAIRLYQKVVSPWTHPSCRFLPTCSEYAIQALGRYGVIKGLILSIYRLLRCNPWGGYGYDPPRWFGEAREDTAEDG